MTIRIIVCLLFALAVGVGQSRAEAPYPPLRVGPNGHLGAGTPLEGVHRIAFIGDSMTDYGDGPTGYIGIIRSYLDAAAPKTFALMDAGKADDTSREELARFDTDVTAKKPDLAVINSGLNDAWFGFDGDHPHGGNWRGIPLDEFRRNVEQMVTSAQKGSARVMLLSTTLCSEDLNSPQNVLLATYNQVLRDIARRHHCVFVDLQPPFRAYLDTYHKTGGTDYVLTADGVNLSNRGNNMMADTLLTALLSPLPRGAH